MERSARRRAPNTPDEHLFRSAPIAGARAVRPHEHAFSRPAHGPEGDDVHPLRADEPDEAPLYVRYVDESGHAYLVRDLEDGAWMRVAKSRQAAEPFPMPPGPRVPGGRLARWAGWALVAAVAGGVGGIIIGALVASMASLRLIRFSGRVRRWRRVSDQPDRRRLLPAAASAERLRLRTVVWQGLLAAALGLIVFALLSGRVL